MFFHRASRTLYTSDLFFNLHHTSGWLAPIAFRMIGQPLRERVGRWRGILARPAAPGKDGLPLPAGRVKK